MHMFKSKKRVKQAQTFAPSTPRNTLRDTAEEESRLSALLPGSMGFQQRYLGNSHVQGAPTESGQEAPENEKVSGPGKMSLRISNPSSGLGSRHVDKGISASGAATVSITYKPEAADKSTKIVFIQVMRELLDGNPVKPSVAAPAFAYQDADTTTDFYHVDYVSGEADPYYNGDDAADGGTQGNATSSPKVDATMTDTPNYSDGNFPAGKTKLSWEFRTIAFSADGADKGTYYAYARWTYNKEKGKAATVTHQGTSTNTALPKNKAAIKLWNTNHGFAMP
jgi:hypothetical protein